MQADFEVLCRLELELTSCVLFVFQNVCSEMSFFDIVFSCLLLYLKKKNAKIIKVIVLFP